MVDWMLEVFGNYDKTSNNYTYFRAIGIMDNYLYSTKKRLKNDDLHLIGVSCIFIASKYEDVYYISLEDVYHKVGH